MMVFDDCFSTWGVPDLRTERAEKPIPSASDPSTRSGRCGRGRRRLKQVTGTRNSVPRGGPRDSSVILTVTVEKLPHRLYGLGQAHPLDADAGREGAQQPAGQARVEHHEYAAIVGAADQPAIGLLEPEPSQHV